MIVIMYPCFIFCRLFSRGQEVLDDRSLPDELLFGRVGYLFALNFVQRHLGAEAVDQDLLAKVSA